MGKPSALRGCLSRCWWTGAAHYHDADCPNVPEEDRDRLRGLSVKPAPGPTLKLRPANVRPVGDLHFVSDAERAWYESPANTTSPSDQCLHSLVCGRAVSGVRLAWAYEHAKKGSAVKALLAARLRMALGLPADAPIEKTEVRLG